MEYSPEEWSWIEAEWAFYRHGRTAFISPDDFRQAEAWAGEGIPAEVIVAAMGILFDRGAKRPRPRTFVALSHLGKDVAKEMSFRKALSRAGEGIKTDFPGWGSVKEPLQSDPKAKVAFEAWMRLKCGALPPESPGYLERLDSEREAYSVFIEIAAEKLGSGRAALEYSLAEKLRAVDIPEGSAVWKRAWNHHFAKDVCAVWDLEGV
jgi:hypothetical protein